MKFYCDACNTKYAISDEKVHGKVLKVRCKNCGNVITVREAVAPVRGGSGETDPTISAPTSHPTESDLAVPTTQWYYALNGQTFGPFTLEGLRRKYSTAEISDATYVWHEKLGDWTPVANQPAFADALAIGHRIVPRRMTLGFTGPVEAIRVEDGPPVGQRAGAVPDQAHGQPAAKAKPEPKPAAKVQPAAKLQPVAKPERKPTPAPTPAPRPLLSPKSAAPLPESPRRTTSKPAPTAKPAPTPEARPIQDARQGNLDRLRKKLGSELGEPDESIEPLPKPVGPGAIFTYAAGIEPAAAESAQNLSVARANDAVNFELPPRAKPPKPSPSSTSDILERVIGPTSGPPSEVSEVEDSGIIPFFPEGPNLPASIQGATGQEATSESVLIDMGQMRKASRKRGALAAGIAGLVVFAVVGVGATLALRGQGEEKAEVEQPGQRNVHKDDLVIPTYKREEVAKIATLDLEEELLFSEEEAVIDEEPVEQPTAAEKGNGTGAAAVAKAKPVVKIKARKTGESANNVEEGEPVGAVEPPAKVDPLAALLAPRANRTTVIRAPEDKLLTQRQEGLSKDQARRGFQRVKKSIRDCRERHNRYNAKLDAGKLKISVTVEPTGTVSSFTLNPKSVQNTEFANCMSSHQGRWTFAKFSGKPVVINTSVIIQ